jgi:hypothetical protein
MNNEKQDAMVYAAGRAPSDKVWDRIEKHMDAKADRKPLVPEWVYALAVLSLVLAVSAVISSFFV